ncbi:hypothetical protein PTTG_25397 [Puccinia triticina 1-1 BBBD Race 1]|uniref:CCHC-type domain-containing protein n=1 Tax=Puccinia triticina (isolate 1-1 / race 1 (BBBD)) TaxID=630390 RepID=A0A180H524_PUCT1|nr:hypothetical protein PTTG_25397 [Puccinia triticina 1-1 BBBD Race 1]
MPNQSCQDSGLAPEQRKRKERNPNPARGNATSTSDEEPKRPKRSTTPNSKHSPDANSDRIGSSLIERISTSTSVPARFSLVSADVKVPSLNEHKSSHPPLVPAGDFKRATSKAPKTKLAAEGGVHISEPPALQTTVPPSGIGGEHTRNGSATLTSHGISQDPGGVDRPRASPAFDGRLESLFHSPDSSPSDPSPQQESSLQQERRPSPSRAKSSRESSSEKPRRSSSWTQKDGRSAEPSETDSGSHHKQIKDFGKTIQTLTAKIPEKNASNSCECEFNKITFKEDLEDLSTHLKGEMSKQLESIKREVSAIIGSQDQKLVYAVQDVAARIESLGAEITALSLDREQAREFSPRSENTLRQNPDREKSSSIEVETTIPSSSNIMLFGISQEIKNLATAIQEKNHSSISKGTVKAMIAELDEGHRKDFSALSTKLDRLLSQFREDGADVRSELAQLNDRIGSENCSEGPEKEPINRNTYNRPPLSHNTQENYHAPFEQPSHHSVSEIQRHLWGAVNKLEWLKFSGQGEYDHTKFIDWIDTCRSETKVPDEFIHEIKLLSILTGVAGLWYKAMRKDHSTEKWDFWKRAITLQYGTSNWMRKKQEAFDKDKFIAGETPVSSWVTRQYKRLRAFEPQLSLQSINFRLLGLMDREVEYAAKTAMGSTKADMSALINVLEDIFDKTRSGRKKFVPKTTMPEKTVTKSAKTKDRTPTLTGDIKCYTCHKTGHTSRNCIKKINNVGDTEEIQHEEESESKVDDDDDLVIGSSPALAVTAPEGRNNLVRMLCADKECEAPLDIGSPHEGLRDYVTPAHRIHSLNLRFPSPAESFSSLPASSSNSTPRVWT